jgi:ribosomal protein S18 acetylase RimI-like enzyme
MAEQTITLEPVIGPETADEARQLFSEYAQSLNIDLAFQNFEAELNSLPGKYGPPDGQLLLARVDGAAAGCIALRRLSEEICEMKRLYVRDAYRGLGIGRKLVAAIVEEAKNMHYGFIRLDTLPTMRQAQGLYQAFGFYDIEPYVYNPVIGTRFLELRLTK